MNPLQRLRLLPWTSLFLVALLTVFWASMLELLLRLGMAYVPLLAKALDVLFTPPLDIIMSLAIAVGVGVLAVIFLEIMYPKLAINAGMLWALLLCLLLALFVRSVLPIPTIWLDPSYPMLVGNMLGLFWKGRPYWR